MSCVVLSHLSRGRFFICNGLLSQDYDLLGLCLLSLDCNNLLIPNHTESESLRESEGIVNVYMKTFFFIRHLVSVLSYLKGCLNLLPSLDEFGLELNELSLHNVDIRLGSQ